jgi:RNA-directed DNA polymerase
MDVKEESETTNMENQQELHVRALEPIDWEAITWQRVERNVRRLQARIVKAERDGRHGKVKSLMRILTRSFDGRAMAVKQVTTNKGKETPGVDGKVWNTPARKSRAIEELERKGYQAKPLRRVYILKSNGRKRPLGIPVMKDRAMQALHSLALDPIAECRVDKVSFGFRKCRSVAVH